MESAEEAEAEIEAILSIIRNAVGYELFSRDGRPIKTIDGVSAVEVSPAEVALLDVVADRVRRDLIAMFDDEEDSRREEMLEAVRPDPLPEDREEPVVVPGSIMSDTPWP